jgi:hypothetical protein
MPRPFISAGLAWRPRLVPHVVDPALFFEIQDPVSICMDQASVWKLIHLGTEVKLVNMISLRAGLNEGWLSAGLGFDLFFFKLDAAIFTEELGKHPGDQPRTGIVLEAAIRF